MAQTTTYDLVVIGAGAAGLAAARTGKGKDGKRRVALIESAKPGGDCTHYGCVPSKTLLETARRVHAARNGSPYGFSSSVDVDFAKVMGRVRATIAEIEEDESPELLASEGIDLIRGRARFTDDHTVEISEGADAGQRLRSEHIVVATGAGPAVPPVPGLSEVDYLTNRTIFGLTELPEHLLVMGAGPIGCELAQAFRRLGSKVTIVDGVDRLLPNDEPEAGEVLLKVLRREGVNVRLGHFATKVLDGPVVELASGASVRGSHLLVATGRRPDTEGIGLAEVGVAVDPKSHRIVTDATMRTSVPHIYAVGDCTTPFQFTHTGDEQGRLAVRNLFGRRAAPYATDTIPWVTFTEPEVGHVGMTEAQAFSAYGDAARVAFIPMSRMDRARCAGGTDGFVKLITAPKWGLIKAPALHKVVGMTAVAPVGGELIHSAGLAIRTGMLAARLAQTTTAYPTWALAVRYAGAQLFGSAGSARPAAGPPAT